MLLLGTGSKLLMANAWWNWSGHVGTRFNTLLSSCSSVTVYECAMQKDPIPEHTKISSSVIYVATCKLWGTQQDLVFKPKLTSKETFLYFGLDNLGKKLYGLWSIHFYVHPLLRRNSLLRFVGLCRLNRVPTVLNNFLFANHVSPASTSEWSMNSPTLCRKLDFLSHNFWSTKNSCFIYREQFQTAIL